MVVFLCLPFLSFAQKKDSVQVDKAFVIWAGSKSEMTYLELASYCAPVFWFSPDEPELKNLSGKDIRIPAFFPV